MNTTRNRASHALLILCVILLAAGCALIWTAVIGTAMTPDIGPVVTTPSVTIGA